MTRLGWRAWGLAADRHGPVLRSPEYGQAMPALTYGEREAWATCLEADHAPPQPGCACGLYSAESAEAARVWLPPGCVSVVGQVELLGPVVVGAPIAANLAMDRMLPLVGAVLGRSTSAEYRSAGVRLAGPQSLHPDHAASADALAARYGVPFRVDPSLTQTVNVAAELETAGNRLLGMLRRPSGDAAGLLLFNADRTHVVLQLRGWAVDQPNTWGLLGGAVEPGETPVQAALREAWEEARLDRASVRVEAEVALPGYTYVVATADWTPDQDPVLPHSSNAEAQGASWLPVAVLDTPDRFPKMRLHPKLAQAWPTVRAQLGVPC